MNSDYVSLEQLEYCQNYYNKQKGQKYPCSNQVVVCGIFTENRNKAIEYMKNKSVVRKMEMQHEINWYLDNGERWIWNKKWNENLRGRRYYKLVIDRFIDKHSFERIMPYASLYCCSLEII